MTLQSTAKNTITIIFICVVLIAICVLIYFYVKTNENNHESFSQQSKNTDEGKNLIKFGDFEDKHHIVNSEVERGNDIIIYPNPEKSSYVLQQSTSLSENDNKTKYKINLNLDKTKTYKFKCWVNLSEDWNGNNHIFSLKVFNNNDNVFKKSEGVIIKTEKINNITWDLYEYVLEFDASSTGEVAWYLGYDAKNTMGNRYITGVSVIAFNPLLTTFKIINGLQCLVDISNKHSYDPRSLTLKDVSGKNRHFKWSSLTNIKVNNKNTNNNDERTMNNVDISKISLIGNVCSDLGIQTNQNFTIMFRGNFFTQYNNENKELFTFYSEAYDSPFLKIEINANKSTMTITANGIKYDAVNIENSNVMSLYTIIKNESRIFLYKDETMIDTPEIYIYNDNEDEAMLNNYKNFTINSSKTIGCNFSAFAIYNRAVKDYEIEEIKSHLILTDNDKNNSVSKQHGTLHDFKYIEQKTFDAQQPSKEYENFNDLDNYDEDDYVYPYELTNSLGLMEQNNIIENFTSDAENDNDEQRRRRRRRRRRGGVSFSTNNLLNELPDTRKIKSITDKLPIDMDNVSTDAINENIRRGSKNKHMQNINMGVSPIDKLPIDKVKKHMNNEQDIIKKAKKIKDNKKNKMKKNAERIKHAMRRNKKQPLPANMIEGETYDEPNEEFLEEEDYQLLDNNKINIDGLLSDSSLSLKPIEYIEKKQHHMQVEPLIYNNLEPELAPEPIKYQVGQQSSNNKHMNMLEQNKQFRDLMKTNYKFQTKLHEINENQFNEYYDYEENRNNNSVDVDTDDDADYDTDDDLNQIIEAEENEMTMYGMPVNNDKQDKKNQKHNKKNKHSNKFKKMKNISKNKGKNLIQGVEGMRFEKLKKNNIPIQIDKFRSNFVDKSDIIMPVTSLIDAQGNILEKQTYVKDKYYDKKW
jgi:hypothetical protein